MPETPPAPKFEKKSEGGIILPPEVQIQIDKDAANERRAKENERKAKEDEAFYQDMIKPYSSPAEVQAEKDKAAKKKAKEDEEFYQDMIRPYSPPAEAQPEPPAEPDNTAHPNVPQAPEADLPLREAPPAAPAPATQSAAPAQPEGAGPTQAPSSENIRPAPDYLSAVNQSLWTRMSGPAQKMFKGLYEGVYKTPGINRLTAKLEMGYNQFWGDRHEKKAVKYKTQIDALDLQSGIIDKAKAGLQKRADDLRAKGSPGAADLELQIKKLERDQAKLANKKDKAQSKFEKRENKLKNFTNERDRVADKLISYYNEKLQPFEKDLADLKRKGDEISLLEATFAATCSAEEASIKEIQKSMAEFEDGMKAIGHSDRRIARMGGFKIYKQQIEEIREKMAEEKQDLEKQRAQLNAEIARVDERANPKRDLRDRYARIKQDRPVDMKVPKRPGEEDSYLRENAQGHTRPERVAETEGQEELPLDQALKEWNDFLATKSSGVISPDEIIPDQFMDAVGHRLASDGPVKFKDFQRIVIAYYKFRNQDVEQLEDKLEEFYETKVKARSIS